MLIIGGGAAGYFAAITAAERNPHAEIHLAEAGSRPLQKVAISGGGRCNVTHACFDNKKLIEAYPRGQRELLGAFSRFQPQDTVEWFKQRGVKLKTEADGRMFPITDSSETIIECLENARREHKVQLHLKTKVSALKSTESGNSLQASLRHKSATRSEYFDAVLLASGSASLGYKMAKELGHHIEPCVPSLFTFEINDPRIADLSGISVENCELRLVVPGNKPLTQKGPLLITHWGLSGPAVIKLSAWGARELHQNKYRAELKVNYYPEESREQFVEKIKAFKQANARKSVQKHPPIKLPKRLWENLCTAADIDKELKYAELPGKSSKQLASEIFDASYQVSGKGVFKEEFVTCGGVRLSEVDFRSMQSKLNPMLYLAGEVLDIDGITGGYNFQSAWTTGHIAGMAI